MKKLLIGAAVIGAAATSMYVLRPADGPTRTPTDELVVTPDDDDGVIFVPFTAYLCCDAAGNCWDATENLAGCAPSDKIIACGCPSTNEDGGITCNC